MNISLIKCFFFIATTLTLNLVWHSPAAAWPEEGRAAIMPSLAKIEPGESQQFYAVQLPRRMQVARPAEQVTWTVNGVVGGNDTFGHIDSNGLYRAPTTLPSMVHIGALVPDSSNKVLFATVLKADASSYRSEFHWPKTEIEKASQDKILGITLDLKGQFILNFESGGLSQFTKEGTFVASFGRNVEGKPFGGVIMVAVAPSGQVYTGDLATGPPRVNVFNPDGDWLLGFAQKGSRKGMVMTAVGIAFHPQGDLYVADQDAMRISIYDANHTFVRYLRNDAPEGHRTNTPAGVAFDASGDLFVASAYGPCEKVNPETGERLMAFAFPVPPKGMMYIDDVCLDQWGDVYLAVRSGADVFESGPDHGGVASIMKYTNSGDYLTSIQLSANAPKRVAVEVDSDGRLYAAYSTEYTEGVEVFVQD